MSKPQSPSAKQQVLDWVRSKNPQTMELKFGCKIAVGKTEWTLGNDVALLDDGDGWWILTNKWEEKRLHENEHFEILGSDMGLPELLMSLEDADLEFEIDGIMFYFCNANTSFDMTKNLHQQSDEFFQAILPLIPND